MGREHEMGMQTSRINNMSSLAKLAQAQQTHNNDNIMLPVRNSMERASLEEKMQGNRDREFKYGVMNELGQEHYVDQERVAASGKKAEHYANMAKWAGNMVELSRQVPSAQRKQWLAVSAKQAGFDEIINESFANANPDRIPEVLGNIATTAYDYSAKGIGQQRDIAATAREGALNRGVSTANNIRNNQTSSANAELNARVSMRNTDARIGSTERMQQRGFVQEADMLDARTVAQESLNVNNHMRQLGLAGVENAYKNLTLEKQHQFNKELQAGRIAAESLKSVQDAETKLNLMQVDHDYRVALAQTEHQLRMELQNTQDTARAALKGPEYDMYTDWINTNMKAFDKQAEANWKAGQAEMPTEMERLQYRASLISSFANYMREKAEGTQTILKDGNLVNQTSNPKLERPVVIDGKSYTKQEIAARIAERNGISMEEALKQAETVIANHQKK